jgi:hypothetical protein
MAYLDYFNMNGLITSAYDPVFFLHHCYIDYVWEQFRFQQFSRGINPQNDFPNTGVEGHWPWSTMVNLGRIRNVDGYHNAFTQFVYEYESSPNPVAVGCVISLWNVCDNTAATPSGVIRDPGLPIFLSNKALFAVRQLANGPDVTKPSPFPINMFYSVLMYFAVEKTNK